MFSLARRCCCSGVLCVRLLCGAVIFRPVPCCANRPLRQPIVIFPCLCFKQVVAIGGRSPVTWGIGYPLAVSSTMIDVYAVQQMSRSAPLRNLFPLQVCNGQAPFRYTEPVLSITSLQQTSPFPLHVAGTLRYKDSSWRNPSGTICDSVYRMMCVGTRLDSTPVPLLRARD